MTSNMNKWNSSDNSLANLFKEELFKHSNWALIGSKYADKDNEACTDYLRRIATCMKCKVLIFNCQLED
jgi:hypothetical protein